MIPKVIHYCWFGRGELPELAEKCIASWKKYYPDYEIIQWNEDNFDVNCSAYTRYCYEQGKYAFLSDYARLAVVKKLGGIYFDTDVEVVRPLGELMQRTAFFGFENDCMINTGIGFGAEPGHPLVAAMLEQYESLKAREDGGFDLQPCPALNTAALLPFGLRQDGQRQIVCGAEILPVECMNPYEDSTGRLHCTENTLSIHWYSKSWLDWGTVLRSKLTKPFHRIFGTDCFQWLRRHLCN